ncbi:Type I transmembrane sorting receptor, partial [Blyttiomyces sp. JEL0837]
MNLRPPPPPSDHDHFTVAFPNKRLQQTSFLLRLVLLTAIIPIPNTFAFPPAPPSPNPTTAIRRATPTTITPSHLPSPSSQSTLPQSHPLPSSTLINITSGLYTKDLISPWTVPSSSSYSSSREQPPSSESSSAHSRSKPHITEQTVFEKDDGLQVVDSWIKHSTTQIAERYGNRRKERGRINGGWLNTFDPYEKVGVVPGSTTTGAITAVKSGVEEVLTGGPFMTGCFNVEISVGGTKFKVQLDSGSTDLLVPGIDLNGYSGPTYDYRGKSPIRTGVHTKFADLSSWQGNMYMDTVSVVGMSVSAPFAVMITQTSNPIVTDGASSEGLFGIGFDELSSYPVDPRSVRTALSNSKQLAQDIIAFRGCPATSNLPSIVNWGGTDPSLTCTNTGFPIGYAAVSDTTGHFAVNVLGVGIGITNVAYKELILPDRNFWQIGLNQDSIVDSCTTLLYIYDTLFEEFADTIIGTKVFQRAGVSNRDLENFLYNLNALPS